MLTFKKVIGKIHLWLGMISGLLVLFMGITGCILAYQLEIENATQPYRFVPLENRNWLKPSELKQIADKHLPGKLAHSVNYERGKAAQVSFYQEDPAYYYLVFINPYSGEVLKVKNMDDDFFRIVIMGHYYLWLPPEIGQPIVATGTLLFFILLISGIVLWWPKSQVASKQRFTIKWSATWPRKNYDLHNVTGFYISWIVVFIAITGLVMGFRWVEKSVYWVASGGKPLVEYYETYSDTASSNVYNSAAIDILWKEMLLVLSATSSMEVHYPADKHSSIEVLVNPDPGTYWRADYRYFDQYSLKELEVKHPYGRYEKSKLADKLMRMNYDIHIGAIGGVIGKTIAFFASLFASSLPVTGFMIWWNRKKKNRVKISPANVARHRNHKKVVLKYQNLTKRRV